MLIKGEEQQIHYIYYTSHKSNNHIKLANHQVDSSLYHGDYCTPSCCTLSRIISILASQTLTSFSQHSLEINTNIILLLLLLLRMETMTFSYTDYPNQCVLLLLGVTKCNNVTQEFNSTWQKFNRLFAHYRTKIA